MNITDLQPRQGKVDVTVTISELTPPRTIAKPGFSGTVQNVVVKDDTGSITVTLWNDDAGKYQVGDKIRISNGFVSEYQGQLQLSAGKFGKIEKI
jgi:replication factor A1